MDLMVLRSGAGLRDRSEPFDAGIQLTERFDTEPDRPIEAHGITICLSFDQIARILGLNPADQGSTDTSVLPAAIGGDMEQLDCARRTRVTEVADDADRCILREHCRQSGCSSMVAMVARTGAVESVRIGPSNGKIQKIDDSFEFDGRWYNHECRHGSDVNSERVCLCDRPTAHRLKASIRIVAVYAPSLPNAEVSAILCSTRHQIPPVVSNALSSSARRNIRAGITDDGRSTSVPRRARADRRTASHGKLFERPVDITAELLPDTPVSEVA